MRNLFIDTSSSRIIVALADEDHVIYAKNVENGMDLSSRIFPIIDEVFEGSQCAPDALNRIYVVNGPGSFTGVRIGVTIAKTMAWSLGKEIVTISELEFMAMTSVETEYVVSFIDARRESVYAGIYSKDGVSFLKDQYISVAELLKKLPKSVTFVGYDKINVDRDIVEPNVDIMNVIERHQLDISLNPHEVKPNYLKLTEAEENLARNQG